jgi:hypothetical protein
MARARNEPDGQAEGLVLRPGDDGPGIRGTRGHAVSPAPGLGVAVAREMVGRHGEKRVIRRLPEATAVEVRLLAFISGG